MAHTKLQKEEMSERTLLDSNHLLQKLLQPGSLAVKLAEPMSLYLLA